MLQDMFFIIFMTAIYSKPTPEIRFLPGKLRGTLLPKERYGDSLRGTGLNHPAFQFSGGRSTTELSQPHRNVRRQCLRVK